MEARKRHIDELMAEINRRHDSSDGLVFLLGFQASATQAKFDQYANYNSICHMVAENTGERLTTVNTVTDFILDVMFSKSMEDSCIKALEVEDNE